MKETQEIILAALAKVTDERAERTPVIISGARTTLHLALTPSQLCLLDTLKANGMLANSTTIKVLTDIEWEMP